MTANRSRPLAGGNIVFLVATALLVLALVFLPVAGALVAPGFASILFPLLLFFLTRAPAAPLAAIRTAPSGRGPPLHA